MKAQTPALEHSQALWEQAMRSEATSAVACPRPGQVAASGDVILTSGRDHSVMASRPQPGIGRLHRRSRTTLPRITAVRLEALPDPSLPKGGPGRDVYGNFQVNGVEIEAEPIGLEESGFVPVGFKAIKSDDGGATSKPFSRRVSLATPTRRGAGASMPAARKRACRAGVVLSFQRR